MQNLSICMVSPFKNFQEHGKKIHVSLDLMLILIPGRLLGEESKF